MLYYIGIITFEYILTRLWFYANYLFINTFVCITRNNKIDLMGILLNQFKWKIKIEENTKKFVINSCEIAKYDIDFKKLMIDTE